MKKLTIFLLSLVLLFSCASDDNNTSTPSIFGKWQPTKYELYENGALTDTDTKNQNSNCPDYLNLNGDFTFRLELFESDCAQESLEEGSFTYQEGVLTTLSNGTSVSLKVQKLSNTEMIYKETVNSQTYELYYFNRVQ